MLVSTGGGDFTHPRGEAIKVEGGYRVSGASVFASQSSAGTVMSTMFAYDDPDRGPAGAQHGGAVRLRGRHRPRQLGHPRHARHRPATTSCSTDVFVPDERVLANRPYGVIDPPLQVIVEHRDSDHLRRLPRRGRGGVRRGARRRGGAKADDPIVQRSGRPDAPPAAGRRRGRSTARSTRLGDDPDALVRRLPRRHGGQGRDRPSPASRCATSPWRLAGGPPSSRARRSSAATATSARRPSTR